MDIIDKEMNETRDAIARKYPVAYIHMYLQGLADIYDEDAAREQMITMQDKDPDLWQAAHRFNAFCCPPITTDRDIVDDDMYIDLCALGCEHCWQCCREDNLREWLKPYLDEDPRKRAHYERYYKRVDPDG